MQTIVFDVDDTLYDQALSFHNVFRELVDQSKTYEEIDQIYRVSRKHSERLFDQSEAGEITELEWQIGRIIAACKDFHIPMDGEKALFFHKKYIEEQRKITLFDDVEQLLNNLYAQEKQLAILTNGEAHHQSMKIEQLHLTKWIPENHIFISGDHGHAKPKKEIFHIIENHLDLNKSETVYIGDSFEKDIIGAKQVGWQAIWMNHRKRKIPENSTIQADYEVHSAKALLELFK
ncbi:Putative HAD-hydrolase YfnB [Paraliobacillus sp. PM-2]|uniref:HAD family hydrolase n=1 Tax=Paraliobacillus sp. PM-2 TaxID=1462524 RepID=UPI00061B9118|nr:HAD family hydrolase [Paraliobacillus sp. PM-2]CQR47120.1 Putative HAD-hydrolase YfnB [Paraliobacillus sp. PM-2]